MEKTAASRHKGGSGLEFTIIAGNGITVNFSPGSVAEEVYQNVNTVLATPVYSVPLNRAFGANTNMLDLPLPVAQAKLTAEIMQAIQKFEPRVTVTKVQFSVDAINGKLIASVSVRLKE